MSRTIIFAALLAILGIFLVFANISLRRERNELKTALDASLEYVERLKDSIERQAEALSEREKKIASLSSERQRLSKRLKEAAEHEESVKLWIDTRIPDAISGMLRGESGNTDTAATPSPMQ